MAITVRRFATISRPIAIRNTPLMISIVRRWRQKRRTNALARSIARPMARNGSPRPSAYPLDSTIACPAVSWLKPRVRIAPSVAPTHGVHPAAKNTPMRADATHPLLRRTLRCGGVSA